MSALGGLALGVALGVAMVACAFIVIGWGLNKINPPPPKQECFPLDQLARVCQRYLSSAPNYVEIRFSDETRDPMLVTVQRLHAPTPHEKRVLAEQRVAELEAAMRATGVVFAAAETP